jgi:hypothetical protein
VLDRRIRAREHEPLVPVVTPSHPEGRCAVLSVHFEDLGITVALSDVVPLDHESVSDRCAHDVLPISAAGRASL